jgi:predicted phosphoribosyltransferase
MKTMAEARRDLAENWTERSELRDRAGVFGDRADAGESLAGLLEEYRGTRAMIFAIPAGGVPVAAAAARRLNLPLDVAVVSKMTPPGNTEIGYGAVAFDGTFRVNAPLVVRLGLSREEVEQGTEATLRKVTRRVGTFRGKRPWPDLAGRTAILVDDGLASGFTALVAAEALRRLGAERIALAVPTGPRETVRRVAGQVDRLFCANVRGGASFAVADAYRRWSDVTEEEARQFLEQRRRELAEEGVIDGRAHEF